ncbi:MAG: hypothetical protein SGI92_20010 [Bryobacteraceae bacterium]|nr:hypothetical protein [Bryobacteraceae bacterium]
MTDTPLDVVQDDRARYMALSPSDRVVMACAMFDSAKSLASAGIQADYPGISEVDLRIALFDRFYGRDVTADDRATIVERIRSGR